MRKSQVSSYHIHFLPFLRKYSRGVLVVDFTESLHRTKNTPYRLGHRLHRLPLGKVLDVPLSFAGKVL